VDDDSGRTTVTRDWRRRARCRSEDPDTLFVQGAQQRDVREVCKACPVRTECLAHALDNRIRFGVWGGMTERERRALLKRRPDVVSWAGLLEAARRAAMRPQQPAAADAPGAPGAPAARRPAASGERDTSSGGSTPRRGNDRQVG
jgi:WhiB family redox-sensing transcriptional regulator